MCAQPACRVELKTHKRHLKPSCMLNLRVSCVLCVFFTRLWVASPVNGLACLREGCGTVHVACAQVGDSFVLNVLNEESSNSVLKHFLKRFAPGECVEH